MSPVLPNTYVPPPPTDAVARYAFPCGCEAESLTTRYGHTHHVPLAACGDHCSCVACARVRARLAGQPKGAL